MTREQLDLREKFKEMDSEGKVPIIKELLDAYSKEGLAIYLQKMLYEIKVLREHRDMLTEEIKQLK